MTFQFDILSAEQLVKCSVGWHPVFEFERVINASVNSRLLHCPPPGTARKKAATLRRGMLRSAWRAFPDLRATPPDALKGERILFVSALNPASLSMLDCIPNWRKLYDTVIAYVVDSYPTEWYFWLKRYLKIDHIFVPIRSTVASTQKATGVKTHYLPFAADTVRYSKSHLIRAIDVIGYGRQPQELMNALEGFNAPSKSLSFLRSTPRDGTFQGVRDGHFRLLSLSKIAMAFATEDCYSRPGLDVPVSIVTPRWAECLASGCLVAGSASDEARALFDWEDAIIELPKTVSSQIDAIHELLASHERLARCHARNTAMMRERHDWRHRIKYMFETLGLTFNPTRSDACLSQHEP